MLCSASGILSDVRGFAPRPEGNGEGTLYSAVSRAGAIRPSAMPISRCVPPSAQTSPDRRGVLYAAGVPQLVEPARNGEPRFRPEIAVEHLPVIADRADDVGGPGVGQPHLFAEAPRRPDEAHDFGLLRLQRLPDGFRADAQLLAVEHGEMDPSD